MFKKLFALLLLVVFVFTCIPVMAAEEPVTYKATITVTKDGGRYQVGFVNIEFKKDFLDADMLPATFKVEVSIKDGAAGIEIEPSTPAFFKAAHIRVDSYDGLLYDYEKGTNVQVHIKKQQIKAEHFSRYAFS